MATSALVTHCGAREVSREELYQILAPSGTATWFPLAHSTVVETVEETLQSGGFRVRGAKYALSRNDHRLFATLDLDVPLAGSDVTLAVGVRNSTDKSLPLGFCAGNRVFVCDNLSFRSELLVTRKHTRYGKDRFHEAICEAVASLHQFQTSEARRIQQFQHLILSDERAESLILRSYERGIISHRFLPAVIQNWRDKGGEEFQDRSLWCLENAFTAALRGVRDANPQRFCGLSIDLQSLLASAAETAAGSPLSMAA